MPAAPGIPQPGKHQLKDFIFVLVPAATFTVSAITPAPKQQTALTLDPPLPPEVNAGAHFCLSEPTVPDAQRRKVSKWSVFEVQSVQSTGPLRNRISPKAIWWPSIRVFSGCLSAGSSTQMVVETSSEDRNAFSGNIEAFKRALEALSPAVSNVEVVEYEQQFRIGEVDNFQTVLCPRAILKVSASQNQVPAIQQAGYRNNIFTHEWKLLAMQALLEKNCQSLNGCGEVYLEQTQKSNKSSDFTQFDNDEDFVDHCMHMIRNLFAHGNEKKIKDDRLPALAHQW